MWETLKSIAFVITTVMIALILQARADLFSAPSSEEDESMQQLDFASSLPIDFHQN